MPGPSPIHRPLFTVQQLAQAQRIAQQHQAPHAQVQRARLCLLLHEQPWRDHVSLARELGRHPKWVQKWRQRWATHGFSLADQPGRGRKPVFSPLERTIVKAVACELPRQHQQPLARYSLQDLVRRVEQEPRLRPMSRSTIWRILASDAIKPWQHHCWLFPRDPLFVEKARVVLDLYEGLWQGSPLSEDDYIISADEKTSIQARIRLAATRPPAPGQPLRYEHEYERGGALQYLAAWDVRRAVAIGLCEPKTGIEPFHRLVDKVMTQVPYRQARRVFWLVDGGSSHRGEAFANRLRTWYPNAIAVALPVHASWLNQIEIYFSIIQRKVLTPNDFNDLEEVRQRLIAFEAYYAQIAEPFDWRFTSKKLEEWYDQLQDWEKLCRVA